MKMRIVGLLLALQMGLSLLPAPAWATAGAAPAETTAAEAAEPETPGAAPEEAAAAGEAAGETAPAESAEEGEPPAAPAEEEESTAGSQDPAAEDPLLPETPDGTALPPETAAMPALLSQEEAGSADFLGRLIPAGQVYGAKPLHTYDVPTDGSALHFSTGTRYIDDAYTQFVKKPLERKDLLQCYFKVTLRGTFGSLEKDKMLRFFCGGSQDSYRIAMNEIEPFGNYRKWIDKDTLIVQIDLYDENKQFKQTVNAYSAIMAAAEDGTFLTYASPEGKYCSLYFSHQDNLFKAGDAFNQLGSSQRVNYFLPVDSWVTDLRVANSLLGDMPPFEYEFIQHEEITGKEQYMTNNILSVNEFIDPYDTYYMVGRSGTGIDPVVKAKVENVKSYAEYLYTRAGDTWRHLLLEDGTLVGVASNGKVQTLATGVTQVSRSHYLKNGTLYYMWASGSRMEDEELVSGVRSFAEHIYGSVVGYIKNDGSCFLQYSYSACEDAYSKGPFQVMGKGKAKLIVPGGILDQNNAFYRWTEEVVGLGYDEEAWNNGQFIERNSYKLGMEHLTDNAVRVFPYEKFLAQYDPDSTIKTGFVQNGRGEMWAFGLQAKIQMGVLEENGQKQLIKHIFPAFQTQQPKWKDNGQFVGLVPEENGFPYGLVANHCTGNKPEVGRFAADYLSDVPGGYKAMDRYTYAFDNNADNSIDGRRFKMKPTEFHYLNDSSEVFKALNTSTNPVGNLYLLPNVARSSYHQDNGRGNTVLLERTDGSMWMTQIYPKASASITVAKLGGWECSNAIQITAPTNTTGKRTRFVDYIDLADRATLEKCFPGLGGIKYPEDDAASDYMVSDYYTQIGASRAQKLYNSSGDPFLLLVTKTGCGNCRTMQRQGSAQRIIEECGVPIYGTVDDYGALKFVSASPGLLTTPYFALVYPEASGVDKDSSDKARQVEIVCPVVSGRIDESKIYDIVQRAKALGVKTDKSLEESASAAGKLPTGKLSVSEQEWGVLKLVNRARKLNNKPLLAMPGELQAACNIREKELITLYEHKRPNGKAVYTTIPAPLDKGSVAENIACNQHSAAQVVSDWLHSPGHCANILDASNRGFAYMGVGFINSRPRYWVQLFASGRGFTHVTTSAGTLTFPSETAMQQEYLICTDAEGVVSYLPIDVQAMTKEGDDYKLALVGYTVTLRVSRYDPELDINGDNRSDPSDMQCLFEYLSTGKKLAHPRFMELLDMNRDGSVDILDYQALYERLKS